MKKKRIKRKSYYTPWDIEVEEYVTGNYRAPGKKRAKRQKPTPEQIRRQNRTNKVNSIRRYLKLNFLPGDYWITLTCRPDQRPETLKEAVKQRAKFLDKLRKAYRAAGQELKWIGVTERGSRGGIHHHLVINRIPEGDRMIADCWKAGKVWMELIYEEGGCRDLAEYLQKQEEEAEESAYSHSRNLIKPEPVVDYLVRMREPRPRKGYYLDKDSIHTGINPVTGCLYQHYTMVKIKKRE